MDNLKLLIFATAYPNPHYLPNLDMLLQLQESCRQHMHIHHTI